MINMISHNPNVPASVKTLERLEEARTKPYPKQKKKAFPPLPFDIDVQERSPTADEFSELIYMVESAAYTVFLKQAISQSYKAHPTNAQSLYNMVQEDPTMMRWPILVNYQTQEIGIDQEGVKGILNNLVVARDGQPKPPDPPASRRTPPESTAWIDYD
jgi:arsenate reductase-like glutaredoxin family protein